MKRLYFLACYNICYWNTLTPTDKDKVYTPPNRSITKFFARFVSVWSTDLFTIENLIDKEATYYLGR